MKALLLILALAMPAGAQQVFPSDIKDPDVLRNMEFLLDQYNILRSSLTNNSLTPSSPGIWKQYVSSMTTARFGAFEPAIDGDDSIPQITQGFQVAVATITPTATTSRIIARATLNSDEATNNCDVGVACIFKDTNADAVSCSYVNVAGSPAYSVVTVIYVETAASLTQRNFSVRLGCGVGNTMKVNTRGGLSYYGLTVASGIELIEISGP